MTNNFNQPQKYDVVLGCQSPTPNDGVVLGGIDKSYKKLETFLFTQQWQKADLQTKAIMLEASNRKKAGYLRLKDIAQFPASDLIVIDNLWKKYSQENFGLSIQANIWRSLGGTANPDWNLWCRFGDRIGWFVNESWLYWNDVSFSIDAPMGHLPRSCALAGWGLGDFWQNCPTLSSLAFKLETYSIEYMEY